MKDIWGKRLFKAGAIVLILLGLVHSLSLVHPMVPTNDTEKQLLELMTKYRFDLMGSPRSMQELLQGFSISFMVWAIGLGILDLALSRERPALLKRLALINAIWLIVMTATSLRYFFLAPTAFLATELLLFVLAWVLLPANSTS